MLVLSSWCIENKPEIYASGWPVNKLTDTGQLGEQNLDRCDIFQFVKDLTVIFIKREEIQNNFFRILAYSQTNVKTREIIWGWKDGLVAKTLAEDPILVPSTHRWLTTAC